MALEWLPLVANLMRGVTSTREQFRGIPESAGERMAASMLPMQHSLAGEIANLSRVQYQPNNQIFRDLYNEESGYGRRNLADAIAEIGRQNRMQNRLGRTPLLDRERGGESVFRNLMSGYQNVQQQAMGNARNRIGQGINGLSSALGGYNNVIANATNIGKQQTDRYRVNTAGKIGGYGSIADMLESIGSMNMGGY